MADDRDDLLLPWSTKRTGLVLVTLWLAYDIDGYVSGAGRTAEAAWASALNAELLAISEDDSGERPTGGPALDAEVAARAQRHRLVQLRLPPDDVTVFATKVLGIIEDRVLQLIAAAVGAEPEP